MYRSIDSRHGSPVFTKTQWIVLYLLPYFPLYKSSSPRIIAMKSNRMNQKEKHCSCILFSFLLSFLTVDLWLKK